MNETKAGLGTDLTEHESIIVRQIDDLLLKSEAKLDAIRKDKAEVARLKSQTLALLDKLERA